MKIKLIKLTAIVALGFTCLTSNAQTADSNSESTKEASELLLSMIKEEPRMQTFFDNSYGYAIFPKVTKGALVIGGAAGNGFVFKNQEVVGSSQLIQVNVGAHFGGQQYSEVIFFQNKEAYDHFMNNKMKFDAQASAVVLTAGVSVDAPYINGVAVFTHTIGGLMVEASIGGQHFENRPFKQ